MKNLLSVIVLSLLFVISNWSAAQSVQQPVNLVQYKVDKKLHARGIASHKKNLFIAASDSKLYIYNSKTETVEKQEFPVKSELRDVEVTKKQIILLASGDSSSTISIDRKSEEHIIRNFENLFLDGISIYKKTMFMMGDPVNGAFSLFNSIDLAYQWSKLDSVPLAIKGEAGFAASGTNVHMTSKKDWYFVSGGMDSRLYQTDDAGKTWSSSDLGFKPCESCGAYSFVVLPDNRTIIAVGGDYTKPIQRVGTCRISNDGGVSWHSPKRDLNGYRSNLIYYKGELFACGSNGIDISLDFGETWKPFSYGKYFAMTIFRKQLAVSSTNGTVFFFDLKKKPSKKKKERKKKK